MKHEVHAHQCTLVVFAITHGVKQTVGAGRRDRGHGSYLCLGSVLVGRQLHAVVLLHPLRIALLHPLVPALLPGSVHGLPEHALHDDASIVQGPGAQVRVRQLDFLQAEGAVDVVSQLGTHNGKKCRGPVAASWEHKDNTPTALFRVAPTRPVFAPTNHIGAQGRNAGGHTHGARVRYLASARAEESRYSGSRLTHDVIKWLSTGYFLQAISESGDRGEQRRGGGAGWSVNS